MFFCPKKINKSEKKPSFVKKMGALLILLFFGFSLLMIPGTDSFFADEAVAGDIEFAAGKWIPALTMEISPSQPDGKDGRYKEAPCVKLFSDIDDVIIYYSFKGKNILDGQTIEGICLYPPMGESNFSAYAANSANEEWKSEIINLDFKVGDEPAGAGDVVINELMWMGSFDNSADEWIELRNMTNRDIDLSKWKIMYGGSGQSGHIEIPAGYSIKANGYFLITAQKWKNTQINLKSDLAKDEGYTNVSEMSLKNEGELLILENKEREIIDAAWQNEKWAAGLKEDFLHASMERNDEPGNGVLSSSWHTCTDKKCNDEKYWKEEGFDFGTPGKKNSKESDLTEEEIAKLEEKLKSEAASEADGSEEIKNEKIKREISPVINLNSFVPIDAEIQNNLISENKEVLSPETDQEPVLEEKNQAEQGGGKMGELSEKIF